MKKINLSLTLDEAGILLFGLQEALLTMEDACEDEPGKEFTPIEYDIYIKDLELLNNIYYRLERLNRGEVPGSDVIPTLN